MYSINSFKALPQTLVWSQIKYPKYFPNVIKYSWVTRCNNSFQKSNISETCYDIIVPTFVDKTGRERGSPKCWASALYECNWSPDNSLHVSFIVKYSSFIFFKSAPISDAVSSLIHY
jgi:hypothetical protein